MASATQAPADSEAAARADEAAQPAAKRPRKRKGAAAEDAGEQAAAETTETAGAASTPKRTAGSERAATRAAARQERRGRKKAARFETGDADVKKKKRARLEKMRRAGIFGVPGRPRRPKRRKSRDELVRPSPPLEQTDPLRHYLAGEMVPCPVGCGGFSEVVRIGTKENGGGEIWFECLSCAQRRMFDMAPASMEERKAIFSSLEGGLEPFCPRHTKQVQLRRRGRELVCPECGVSFAEPAHG